MLLGLGLLALLAAGGFLWFGATQGSRPTPPTPTHALATSAASISLAWDPSASDRVAGYRILWGTEPGRYVRSTEVGNQTTAKMTGMVVGTRYYIVVVAIDAHGVQSPPSNEIQVVPRE